MSWIVLSNGKPFDFTEATMPNVTPEVIAHSLSMQCRYAGHVPRFYSVAEHCWHLAMQHGTTKEERFALLMHDAHEAVAQDIVRPMKTEAFRVFEDRMQAMFEARFGYRVTEEVKRLDNAILASEAEVFFGKDVSGTWSLPEPPLRRAFGPGGQAPICAAPTLAENLFLDAYHMLVPS